MHRSAAIISLLATIITAALPSYAQISSTSDTLDISGRFTVTSDGECRFSPELDRGFAQLKDEDDEPRMGLRTVQLAGGTNSAIISYIRDVAGDEGASARVALMPLQQAFRWNGLAITELQLIHAQETEVRSLVFRGTRAAATAAIRRTGVNLSAINASNGNGDGCGTSVWLEDRPDGVAFTCAGGC